MFTRPHCEQDCTKSKLLPLCNKNNSFGCMKRRPCFITALPFFNNPTLTHSRRRRVSPALPAEASYILGGAALSYLTLSSPLYILHVRQHIPFILERRPPFSATGGGTPRAPRRPSARPRPPPLASSCGAVEEFRPGGSIPRREQKPASAEAVAPLPLATGPGRRRRRRSRRRPLLGRRRRGAPP